jgi:hypothetical protein
MFRVFCIILLYYVCNFVCIVLVILCVVYCFECVCVCVTLCFLCIVVQLPPGTCPLAVNNNNLNLKKKMNYIYPILESEYYTQFLRIIYFNRG